MEQLSLAPEPWILFSSGGNWNFYDANQYQWRFENEFNVGAIERVVARLGESIDHRTGTPIDTSTIAKKFLGFAVVYPYELVGKIILDPNG